MVIITSSVVEGAPVGVSAVASSVRLCSLFCQVVRSHVSLLLCRIDLPPCAHPSTGVCAHSVDSRCSVRSVASGRSRALGKVGVCKWAPSFGLFESKSHIYSLHFGFIFEASAERLCTAGDAIFKRCLPVSLGKKIGHGSGLFLLTHVRLFELIRIVFLGP